MPRLSIRIGRDESRLRRTVMTMGFLILHGIENHRPPEH